MNIRALTLSAVCVMAAAAAAQDGPSLSAPSNLQVTAAAPGKVTFSWDASIPKGMFSTTPQIRYRIERSIDGAAYAQIASAVSETTFTDASPLIVAGGNCSYQVQGYALQPYQYLVSGWSLPLAVTIPDTSSTPDVTTGTVNDGATPPDIDWQASTSTIKANWEGFSAGTSGIAMYRWAIGTDPATEEGRTNIQAFTTDGIAFALRTAENGALTLVAGTKYYVTVQAFNGAGQFAFATSDGVTVDATAPSLPDTFAATVKSSTEIELAWTASTDGGGSGVVAYEIQRSPNGQDGWTTIKTASPAEVKWLDTGLTPGTSYYYHIRTRDHAKNFSAWSHPPASATTFFNPDVTPPNAPTNLTATPESASKIKLEWDAVGDGTGAPGEEVKGMTLYRVDRSPDGTNFTQIDTVVAPAAGVLKATYQDSGLTPATRYWYRVWAVDGAENVSLQPSNVANATTQGATLDTTPPKVTSVEVSPNPTNRAPTVTATASDTESNIASAKYTVDSGNTWIPMGAVEGGFDANTEVVTGTIDISNLRDGRYTVSIKASDVAGNESEAVSESFLVDRTKPSAPRNLAARAVSATAIQLSWVSASDGEGGSGLKSYEISRRTEDGGDVRVFVGPADTSYLDAGLVPNTLYIYLVRVADNADNTSSWSRAKSRTPTLTAQEIEELIQDALSNDNIKNEGVANDLRKKLKNALARLDGGPIGAATNQLEALRRELLQAKSGTSVDPAVATYVASAVQALIKALSAPVLVLPPNGSYTDNTTPLFFWVDQKARDANVAYQIQIAENDSFKSTTFDVPSLGESSFTPGSALKGGYYYWRVRAELGAAQFGPWSDTWKVLVLQPPGKFAGEAKSRSEINWTWNELRDVSRYEVRDENETLLRAVSGSSYLEENLAENTRYTRHVHAVYKEATSTHSNSDAKYTKVHDARTSDFWIYIENWTQAFFNVVPPPNAGVGNTGCKVEYRVGDGPWGLLANFSNKYYMLFSFPPDADSLTFRITYRNADGVWSAVSPEVAWKTPAGAIKEIKKKIEEAVKAKTMTRDDADNLLQALEVMEAQLRAEQDWGAWNALKIFLETLWSEVESGTVAKDVAYALSPMARSLLLMFWYGPTDLSVGMRMNEVKTTGYYTEGDSVAVVGNENALKAFYYSAFRGVMTDPNDPKSWQETELKAPLHTKSVVHVGYDGDPVVADLITYVEGFGQKGTELAYSRAWPIGPHEEEFYDGPMTLFLRGRRSGWKEYGALGTKQYGYWYRMRAELIDLWRGNMDKPDKIYGVRSCVKGKFYFRSSEGPGLYEEVETEKRVFRP